MSVLQDEARDFDEYILTGKPVDCAKYADELEVATGLKFKATKADDIVNGSVTVLGNTVFVHIYTADKSPTSVRKSTLKRPAVMPLPAQISAAHAAHTA